MEREQPSINSQNVLIYDRIGGGCQGIVHLGLNIHSKEPYAIKIINISRVKDKERLERQIFINRLVSSLESPFLPFFHGHWSDQSNIYLAFQKCEDNVAHSLQKCSSPYTLMHVLLYDMLKALVVLESQNIVHRDLKLSNVLIKCGKFKLSDLGLSRVLDGKKLSLDVGNVIAKAPEAYSDNYDCKADMWSLGIIVYTKLFGLPFDKETNEIVKGKKYDEIHQLFQSGKFEIVLAEGNCFLLQIMADMIRKNKQQRFSAQSVLQKYYGTQNKDKKQELLARYLQARHEEGFAEYYYLVMLLLYVDFTQMDEQLAKTTHHHKKQACIAVKFKIFYFLKLIIKELHPKSSMRKYLSVYLSQWESQLKQEKPELIYKSISSGEEALEFHHFQKIKQKFPLVPCAVQVYKLIKDKASKQLWLWDTPIDLKKLQL